MNWTGPLWGKAARNEESGAKMTPFVSVENFVSVPCISWYSCYIHFCVSAEWLVYFVQCVASSYSRHAPVSLSLTAGFQGSDVPIGPIICEGENGFECSLNLGLGSGSDNMAQATFLRRRWLALEPREAGDVGSQCGWLPMEYLEGQW